MSEEVIAHLEELAAENGFSLATVYSTDESVLLRDLENGQFVAKELIWDLYDVWSP